VVITWLQRRGDAVAGALGLVTDLLHGGLLAVRLEAGGGLVAETLTSVQCQYEQ